MQWVELGSDLEVKLHFKYLMRKLNDVQDLQELGLLKSSKIHHFIVKNREVFSPRSVKRQGKSDRGTDKH